MNVIDVPGDPPRVRITPAEHRLLVRRFLFRKQRAPFFLFDQLRQLGQDVLPLPPVIDRRHFLTELGRCRQIFHPPHLRRDLRLQDLNEGDHLADPVLQRGAGHKEQPVRL